MTKDPTTDLGSCDDCPLWHFTSQEGLSSILLGKDGLLAGNTLFMDDREDNSLGRRMSKLYIRMGSLLVERLYKTSVPDETKNGLLKLADAGVIPLTFIACFTKTTKEPRMWSEYTPDGGFAIGFSKKLLEELESSAETFSTPDTDVHRSFNRCDYSQYNLAMRTIEEIEVSLASIEETVRKESILTNDTIEKAISFVKKTRDRARNLHFRKRPEYSWENEMRLAYVFEQGTLPENRLRFVHGKPFVTLDLSAHIRTYVQCIRISPFGDKDKSRAIAHLVGSAIGLGLEQIVDERMS